MFLENRNCTPLLYPQSTNSSTEQMLNKYFLIDFCFVCSISCLDKLKHCFSFTVCPAGGHLQDIGRRKVPTN